MTRAEVLDQFKDQLILPLCDSGGVNGAAGFYPEQIICGDVKQTGKFYQIKGRRAGKSHFLGIDTAARNVQFFSQVRLRHLAGAS